MATVEARIRRDLPIPYFYQLVQLLQEEIERGGATMEPRRGCLVCSYGVNM